jgi:hypothetical protein
MNKINLREFEALTLLHLSCIRLSLRGEGDESCWGERGGGTWHKTYYTSGGKNIPSVWHRTETSGQPENNKASTGAVNCEILHLKVSIAECGAE